MVDQKQIITGLQEAAAYFRSSFDALYGTVACEKFRNWTDAIKQAIALLKAQEPRTVVHGRWVKPERSLWPMADCSVCGKNVYCCQHRKLLPELWCEDGRGGEVRCSSG